ncbi:pilus assembly protein TadG-related protein [Paraburkholderia nodosa]|uniref:pilus assembly protein TadG-related protein n=1 Tax=Paraburkholderia nodosa TaxID=392320 RepID=UPI0004B7E42F|nr:pilus assembly protein TadG-related protein [Paraburkholderia nodosa]
MDKMTRRRRVACMPRLSRREKGTVAIQVAVFLTMLLFAAAIAIDIGRWVVVRHELQNAADAAALAGAHTLPGQLAASAVPATWTAATTAADSAATQYAGDNAANGKAASAQTILVGYYDVANVPSTDVPTSLSQTITSPTDKPAVLVTVGLAGGKNLPLTLGSMFGVTSVQASATAVAIISAPGTALPGVLFPIAMNQCVYQNPAYWSNGQPIAGQEIQIGNGGPSNCAGVAAQWTVLTLDSNPSAYGPCSGMSPSSVPAADCLMVNGNGPPLSVGNNISIQPGVKSTIYNNFPVTPPMQVTLPVVADGSIMSGGSGGDTPIVGFAAFDIDYVIGANGNTQPPCKSNPVCSNSKGNPPCTKCVIGHLTSGLAGGTTAGGTTASYYGAVTPPSLAQLPSSAWY